MDIITLTLGPDQTAALEAIICFHLDNDDPADDAPYDRAALIEVARKLGIEVVE